MNAKIFSIPVVQATFSAAIATPDEQRSKRDKLAKMLDESIAATLASMTENGADATAYEKGFANANANVRRFR